MTLRYIAFLRGINLGRRRPQMSELRALFAELGLEEVETFIASGNVLFSTSEKDGARLETRIAKHLEKSLGYQVDTFVRTAQDVIAIGQQKTFPEEGKEGITIHVGFCHDRPPVGLAKIKTADDAFRVAGKEYYWLCRVRSNESKVWTSPEFKALKLPSSSMRNLSSIRKLIARHLA